MHTRGRCRSLEEAFAIAQDAFSFRLCIVVASSHPVVAFVGTRRLVARSLNPPKANDQSTSIAQLVHTNSAVFRAEGWAQGSARSPLCLATFWFFDPYVLVNPAEGSTPPTGRSPLRSTVPVPCPSKKEKNNTDCKNTSLSVCRVRSR